ncbi:putative mitochondrial cardiolipin hydrolase-like [Apostichopus japonicus]|uniref:Mitochondrial cardiolipin hydrolase n=1 Tax=Stichopus japonicus TaxID=307972 RepID=A0A2G8L637_STIJA|nr:putative mitochondrial cardiolipin hydrolase-like [Apostichopus japonicus]
MNSWHILTASVTIGLISEVVYYSYKKKYPQRLSSFILSLFTSEASDQRLISKLSPPKYFYKVLFFPDEDYPCKFYAWKGGCKLPICNFPHVETSFKLFGDYLYSARSSLDVCVYTITSLVLCEIILDVHKSGTPVRVIIDDESDNFEGSLLKKFRENGVKLRTDKSSFLMHHKFVIIDKETVMNGSFNWTRNAITANNENVFITNNPEVVKPYMEEFEKLWRYFEPNSRLYMKRCGYHSDRQ